MKAKAPAKPTVPPPPDRGPCRHCGGPSWAGDPISVHRCCRRAEALGVTCVAGAVCRAGADAKIGRAA